EASCSFRPGPSMTASLPNMIVRDSTVDDIVAVHAIYAHHVLHGAASFEEVPPSFEEMKSRREAVLSGGFPYLVAEVDGVVQGYAYASLFRPRIAYRYTIEDSVYL